VKRGVEGGKAPRGEIVSADALSGPGVRDQDIVCGIPVEEDDFEPFCALLKSAGLPADDLRELNVKSFRFMRGGKTVGYGAVELYGPHVLLRSVVVIPDARGDGVGRNIVSSLLALAGRLGADRAFLFTTSARAYFEGLGFEAINRSLAPLSILKTRQGLGFCPASAALLTRPVLP
jgi:N-acetylglutamate synthase-like GNAT family acetyltransferase